MCGIFGLAGSKRLSIDRNLLPHRGPDDWGSIATQYHDTHLTLFQSRLSIIGLGPQGHQPFSKDRDHYLVFNGEIYNYRELKTQLADRFRIAFATETDTEVLYESIANLGIDETLKSLNGMFAFVFADLRRGKLFLVRDHLGVKPLYYFSKNGQCGFSSEIKNFFELNLIEPTMNTECLGEYLANGWVYEPDTMFKDIYKVEAGTYIEVDLHELSHNKTRYWDISGPAAGGVTPDIDSIVREQTVADVPYGIYFSGGVDSSILALSLLKERPLLLNLRLNDTESRRVDYFVQELRSDVRSSTTSDESLSTYDRLIYFLDEPIADPAILPAYHLARLAREAGRIVMLSGMGGDEIDAGYTRYFVLRHLLLTRIVTMFPYRMLRGKARRDLRRAKSFAWHATPANFFSLTSYFSKKDIDRLLGGTDWFLNYSEKISEILGSCQLDDERRFLYLDFKGFLASHNLIYMDKASMAASVEVRVPLLDKRLVAAFFESINLQTSTPKRRLKQILKEKLADEYFDVRKQGFRYPIETWIKKDIDWHEVKIYLAAYNLFDNDELGYMIAAAQDEKKYEQVAMQLLAIYTLYRWMKMFKVSLS